MPKLTSVEKRRILRNILVEIDNSLLGYNVNGNPVKREFNLRNIALSMYNKMTNRDRRKFLK